jgi:hypothetical protein
MLVMPIPMMTVMPGLGWILRRLGRPGSPFLLFSFFFADMMIPPHVFFFFSSYICTVRRNTRATNRPGVADGDGRKGRRRTTTRKATTLMIKIKKVLIFGLGYICIIANERKVLFSNSYHRLTLRCKSMLLCNTITPSMDWPITKASLSDFAERHG